MKRILLAALAMAALSSASALAADLPQRPSYKAAPVMVVPPPTWTGCYIGGNIGAAWGRSDVTAVNTGAGVSWTNTGVIGGGQIGCDYEFAGGFVIGARDMFDGTSLNSSGTFGAPLAGFTANTDTSWVNTLTARLGYAIQPNWLLYFQGGGAWTRTNGYVNNPGGAQVGQLAGNKGGWTIGGGAEWMFAPHWSTFLEYNYMDFGTSSGTSAIIGPVNVQRDAQQFLVGVNYRF